MRALMAACRSQTTLGFARSRCRYPTLRSSSALSRMEKATCRRRCLNKRHNLARQQNGGHRSSVASAYGTSKHGMRLSQEWIRTFNTDVQQEISEEKLAIVINDDAQQTPSQSAEKLAIEQKYHDLVNQMDIYIKSTFVTGVCFLFIYFL